MGFSFSAERFAASGMRQCEAKAMAFRSERGIVPTGYGQESPDVELKNLGEGLWLRTRIQVFKKLLHFYCRTNQSDVLYPIISRKYSNYLGFVVVDRTA